MNKKYICIGGAALIGTSLRAIIGEMTTTWNFPYSTLLINITASFLLVVLYECCRKHELLPAMAVTAIGTGLIGSFSTLSAVAYDTMEYLQNGFFAAAAANYLANMILCLLAAACGLAISKMWEKMHNTRSGKGVKQ